MGLGIREARAGLSELVKRVAYQREEFRIGARGADEATLIATEELERLRTRVTELEGALSGQAAGVPFAGLMRRIAAGELTPTGEARPRRRLVGHSQESGISREEMARLGSRGHVEPRRRRTKPRA